MVYWWVSIALASLSVMETHVSDAQSSLGRKEQGHFAARNPLYDTSPIPTTNCKSTVTLSEWTPSTMEGHMACFGAVIRVIWTFVFYMISIVLIVNGWMTAQESGNNLMEAWLLLTVTRIYLRTLKKKPDMMTIRYYFRLLNKNCDIKWSAYLTY